MFKCVKNCKERSRRKLRLKWTKNRSYDKLAYSYLNIYVISLLLCTNLRKHRGDPTYYTHVNNGDCHSNRSHVRQTDRTIRFDLTFGRCENMLDFVYCRNLLLMPRFTKCLFIFSDGTFAGDNKTGRALFHFFFETMY